MRASAWLPSALVAACVQGCGVGALQTARPAPPGTRQWVLSTGGLTNETRGRQVLPAQASVRVGVGERADIGVATLLASGALVDAKVGLLSPSSPLAVSVRGGVGAAAPLFASAWVVHVPLALHVSYDLGARFTPYSMAAYQAYWIFGYGSCPHGSRCVGRRGYGDGVLGVSLGVMLWKSAAQGFVVEYNHTRPIVDDPGDHYSFTTTHFVLAGICL